MIYYKMQVVFLTNRHWLKANQEYLAYKEKTKNELSRVEQDLVKFIDQTGKTIAQKKN